MHPLRYIIMILMICLIAVPIVDKTFDFDKPKPKNKTSTEQKSNRVLSGVFKLPADGTIVDCDTKGRKLHFKEGGWIRLEQLNQQTGKYTWINYEIPSWSTEKRTCETGPHTGDGIVELSSCSGRDMLVRAIIL